MEYPEIEFVVKILIVDDEPKNLQVLGQMLKSLGYKCEFALNATEALKWLNADTFDLVLLDVMMPEMNGYELCGIIKSNDSLNHIPIIFITIKSDIDSTILGFEKGAVDYINKPFNEKELSARISTHIELKKSRDRLKIYIQALESTNEYIMDSILYAQHLQNNILPNVSLINDYITSQFIIYKPKNVIGGDFYWIQKIDNTILLSVIDCIGHGVPGALLSMAAYTALNQAVAELSDLSPANILDFSHKYFLKLFNKDKQSVIDEGMDITFCAIDLKHNKIKVASAKQRLIYIHNNELSILNGTFQSIGDIMSKENNFEEEEITYSKGDRIYLQTDGYIDQFGKESKKKFGSHRYRSFIETLKDIPLDEQKAHFENELANWQGNTDQVDDITVWAIEL